MDYSDVWLNERRMKRMYKSGVKKTRNKFMVIIMRIVLIFVIVAASAGVMAAAGAYLSIIERAPNVSLIFELIADDHHYNSVIIDWRGNEITRLTAGGNRDYVPSAMIPDHVKLAFIAIEDARFFQHNGVDLRSMGRALWVVITNENRTEGASTITQQVVKMKRGIRHNTFESKLQEQVLAMDLERQLTISRGSREAAKDYILEIYLNAIHLGHGTDGVQAAALRYFNKDVWELNLSEAATLAAVTSNPRRFCPICNPERNAIRREIVLNNMLNLGFITQEEHAEAMADDVFERVTAVQHLRALEPSVRSWFDDEVIRAVQRDLMAHHHLTFAEANNLIHNGGLTIVSTMDQRIQGIVDRAYTNPDLFPQREFHIEVEWQATIRNQNTGLDRNVNNRNHRHQLPGMEHVEAYVESMRARHLREGDVIVAERVIPTVQPQSAFMVIDHQNGHVVALAGGRGEKLVDMGMNRAMTSERQPGSTIKTFVYAAGLDLGIFTAATVIDDVPFEWVNPYTGVVWRPGNWWTGPFRGLNSVRQGMIDSMNVLAVRAVEMVGFDPVIDYLNNFGFSTLDERDRGFSPLALGGMTHGMTIIEQTAANAAIANQGIYIEPVFYTLVLDHRNNVLLDNTNPQTHRVISSTTAFIMTDIMEDTVRRGTGQRARLSRGMPAAGKTGTTSDTNDLWFAGFTPYYAATVWLGYDIPRGLSRDTRQAGIHLRLWQYIMEEIHRELPVREFPVPEGMERHGICSASGLLPVSGLCEHNHSAFFSIREEWFEVGTEPREHCNVCVRFSYCQGIPGVSPWALPGRYCPEDHIFTIVGIRRPIPFTGNATVRDAPYEMPVYTCTVHGPWDTAPVQVIPVAPAYEEEADIDPFEAIFTLPGG